MRRGLWITIAVTLAGVATGVVALAAALASIDYDLR